MDVATINSRKRRLKKAIDKSIKGLQIGKNGKLTYRDRQKVKSAVSGGYQKFLIKELTSPTTKTYDWYFTVDGRNVDSISHQRNMLGRNRYFIIDLEGGKIDINNKFSYASTVGSQRVRELEIYSHEIKTIISSSAKIFEGLLRITVSEQEDRKISSAYDTIDEKMIIMATIGAPIAIIGAVEALPFLLAYGESTALPTIGKAFAVNSGRSALINGSTEFASQYVSNGIINNDWGLGGIDVADIAANSIFGKGGEVLISGSIDLSYDKGFQFHMNQELLENMALGFGKKKINSKIDTVISGSIGEFSPSLSNIFSSTSQFNISLLIDGSKRANNKVDE